MNETKRRIAAYKAALPGLRERVFAVALLLVLSLTMLASASFAWLTISRAPELSGVATTVAANGNLEIALSNAKGDAPAESKIGDSSAAEGRSVVESNLTWGNLVNLSDASYGLDNLTLRPAQLNQSSLLKSPLYGAVFSGDGRVEKLNSSFDYAKWQPPKEGVDGYFIVSEDYGVRAISSSVMREEAGFAYEVTLRYDEAADLNAAAGNQYLAITENSDWMSSLATIMGTFMTAKMNVGQGDAGLTNPTMDIKDIQNLTAVFEAFQQVYVTQTEAAVALVNYQLFLKNNSESGSTPYTPYTADMLLAKTEAELKKDGLQVTGLNQMKTDIRKIETNLPKLQALCEQGTVKWEDSGINTIVNELMNVGTCTLDGTPVNNIGASNASGYLDGKTHSAVITNGILFNFEKLNGSRCYVDGLSVSAKVKRMGITIPASITVSISTNAPVPALYATDLEYSESFNQGGQAEMVAEDTYGLAIDLWVRTNRPNTYLTLEGNVLSESFEVNVVDEDANGNTVDIYTIERSYEEESTDEEGNTYTIDLYKVETTDDSGAVTSTTWYMLEGHSEFTLEDGETPRRKTETVVSIIGYEGENRVWEDAKAWEDDSLLSLDSTTQGSGSCYVYYADTPEDQARSLKLLSGFNVAFVDDKGNLLATAVMDTKRYYAESGRVTVPLVLRADSINLDNDIDGNQRLAITALEQNVAKRITALVYLDGTKLSNSDVLAAAEIQGKLNIQFGSSESLKNASDEKLLGAELSVSANITSGSHFKYDEAIENGTPMTTMVELNINGDAPEQITAFFIRQINSAQGSREKEMTFTKQADGKWTGTYTFTAPGNYVLRSVTMDGNTYDLEECPTVTIEGFTVESLSCTQATNNYLRVLTAESSSSVDLKLRFASSKEEAMPTSVQGRFLREDGTAVSITFKPGTGGEWTGKATFHSSGEYTLQYLVLNGEYVELDPAMWQEADIYLGMKVEVFTDSPSSFKYMPGAWEDESAWEEGWDRDYVNRMISLAMNVVIMDDTGNPLTGLSDVTLYYPMNGSALDERGFTSPLRWDAASGYYKGAFASKVGIFNFGRVTVGANTITNAIQAPTFRIISPEPPAYVSRYNSNNTYVYSTAGNIGFDVKLKNSSTATVQAVMLNLSDINAEPEVISDKDRIKCTEVIEDGNVYEVWNFLIPKDASGKQIDGNWQLMSINIWDYYDANGNYISSEEDANGNKDEPMTIDLSGDNIKMKAVVTVNASFAAEQVKNFTGNDFMAAYTLAANDGFSVDIVDFEGKALVTDTGTKLISDVKLTFTYVNGTSSTYGGYSSNSLNNATSGAEITIPLAADKTGTHFVQTADATFLYAGEYTTSFSYKVNDVTVTNNNLSNMPTVTVSTNVPTVKISAISPTGKYSVDEVVNGKITEDVRTKTPSWGTGQGTYTTNAAHKSSGTYTPTFTDYSATVYFKCGHSDNATYNVAVVVWISLPEFHNYTRPSVTLNLAGLSSNMTAKLTFGDNVHIYEGTTQTNGYSWSENGNCVRNIGYFTSASASSDNKIVAGTLTSNQLIVTYDGNEYSFTIPTITINNPY